MGAGAVATGPAAATGPDALPPMPVLPRRTDSERDAAGGAGGGQTGGEGLAAAEVRAGNAAAAGPDGPVAQIEVHHHRRRSTLF